MMAAGSSSISIVTKKGCILWYNVGATYINVVVHYKVTSSWCFFLWYV
jgi:hypothetical protein